MIPVDPVSPPVGAAVLAASLGVQIPLLILVGRSRRLLPRARRQARAATLRRSLMTGVFDGALPADDPGVHAWIAWCHAVAAGGPARPLPVCLPSGQRSRDLPPRGHFLLEQAEAIATAMAGTGRLRGRRAARRSIDLTTPGPAPVSASRHRAPGTPCTPGPSVGPGTPVTARHGEPAETCRSCRAVLPTEPSTAGSP
ncbi:MAG: hypothetical protein QG608_1210 [Actinomycetota bacterium]|nr:hypothetical protein [Actinomycetota bacterium]